MRNAAAGGREMKALFNSYLHTLTNDVLVNPRNPENPDSKPKAAARIISKEDWRDGCFWGMFPVKNFFESGFSGLRRTSLFWV